MSKKIFISWSGKLSEEIAREIYQWLQNLFLNVEIFYSPESIRKGDNGTNVIFQNFNSNIAIIILTDDNLSSTSIMYEAGALSQNTINNELQILFFGSSRNNIKWPLDKPQLTRFNKKDCLKLIHDICMFIPNDNIDFLFENNWDNLSLKINDILVKYKVRIGDPQEKYVESQENYLKRMEYEKKLKIDMENYNYEQRKKFKPYIDETGTIRRS